MRHPFEILIAAALIAAPAAARTDPQQQLDRLLAGRTAGQPVDCINLFPTTRSTTIERQTVVYEVAGTRYVARFAQGCPELGDNRVIVTRTPSSQLCRGDIAQIVETTPAFPVGSCVFDGFIPYRRTDRQR